MSSRRVESLARPRISRPIPLSLHALGGGIPVGYSLLVAGFAGTGKSLLGTQFIVEGIRQGEPVIVAMFEERPEEYAHRAASFGLDLDTPQKAGKLKLLYIRPLDLFRR
jgi:circadian clock protein KaiC